MIGLQSLRRPSLLVVLLLSGNSFALSCDEGEPSLTPVQVERCVLPAPIRDSDTVASDLGDPIDCQCRHCHPDSRRDGGIFSWFRGRSDKDCVAESNATCAVCNVNPEPPFGTSYHATMQAQAAKGEAALMVLHHFDFVPCQGELNYRGRLQLQKIARRALQNPFPIIIEASPLDPTLDSARYAAVISELASSPVPAERVVVGSSPARPMDGLDAQLIHQNLLRLTEEGTAQLLTPTGGVGGGASSSR